MLTIGKFVKRTSGHLFMSTQYFCYVKYGCRYFSNINCKSLLIFFYKLLIVFSFFFI